MNGARPIMSRHRRRNSTRSAHAHYRGDECPETDPIWQKIPHTHFLQFDEKAWAKVSRLVLFEVPGRRGRPSLTAKKIARASALFRFAQLSNDGEIFKRSHIALDLSVRGQIAQ